MGLFSPNHLLLIALIVLLLFGGKKIPELMRGFGKGMREFKNGKDNTPGATGDSRTADKKRPVQTPSAPVSK